MMNHRFFGVILIVVTILTACTGDDPTLVAETAAPLATNTMSSTALNSTNTPHPVDLQVTPIILPNVPSATPACSGTPQTRLIVGERGQVDASDLTPLNVRSGSSTEFRILGRLEPGELFVVLDGPECGGEYVWYLIRNENDLQGWIAEGVSGAYFVYPYLSG